MPEYPRDAWMNRLEGDVTVKFNVNVAGVVEKIRVVQATNQIFVNNSIDAISRFRYAPAMAGGEAVATADVSEQFRFRIVGGVDPMVRSIQQ
jgi:protein TonB